jgi:F-type H+-transporting ATPase subunit b
MLTFPPDFSFLIQIASFVILWVGLKRLLFDPVLNVLELREARTAGNNRAAAAMKAAAEVSSAEYDRRLQEVRHRLSAETEATRSATQLDERRVLATAREQAGAQLDQLRENLARQAQAARPALDAEAHDLSLRMLARVIGRTLS